MDVTKEANRGLAKGSRETEENCLLVDLDSSILKDLARVLLGLVGNRVVVDSSLVAAKNAVRGRAVGRVRRLRGAAGRRLGVGLSLAWRRAKRVARLVSRSSRIENQ